MANPDMQEEPFDEAMFCGYCGVPFYDGGGFYCCVECEEAANGCEDS